MDGLAKKWGILIGVLFLAFFVGRTAALAVEDARASIVVNADASTGWGLSFPKKGEAPVGNVSAAYLREFDAYYMEETQEKVAYLTFDCGYENGNTEAILNALKEHQVPATFFVVGNYLETSPELVKRMVAEGHAVGNHTDSHPDMSKMTTEEAFGKELRRLEEKFEEVTGMPMSRYYRPPQGVYSERNLEMAQNLGYQTIFWSLAYVDWDVKNQPTKEAAFEKLLGRIHPGAVILLHNTSDTNGQIIGELLTKWKEMGYRFEPLSSLVVK